MRILVTGSSGQVGQSLVQQLQERQIDFLALNHKMLDITDTKAVLRTVSEYTPTVIINAAAYTAVDKAEEEIDLAYKVNCEGAKVLAEAARSVDASILHISTDYVFSGDKTDEYQENDITEPQGVYGKSKLAGELAVIRSCEKHIILRTSWVFGEYGHNFVKTMLRLAQEKDTLGIVNDQWGAPTYAGDIASALLTIAEAIYHDRPVSYGVYHFSGHPYVTWFEFASSIFHHAQEKGMLRCIPHLNPLTTEQFPTKAKRPANSRLSMTKIYREFGITASDWKSALQRIQDYKI
ncbi:dTDP-4-dehydrorhamnose reductase [Vibrio mangrovi]|nr:dTDP-4-dehydrorhamnose reductase [Vibrio mangrovi]MDW6003219.1 dTDP-4-dehydrorhamnose reductase [Vibrio mangrovi]